MREIDELSKRYERKFTARKWLFYTLYIGFQLLTLGMAITLVVWYARGKMPFQLAMDDILLCGVCLLLTNLPFVLQKIFKIHFPGYLLVVFYAFLYLHYVVGEILRVYDHTLWFDKGLHILSGVIYTIMGISLVFMLGRDRNPRRIPVAPALAVLFAFCFTMTTEYVWELFEYTMDRLFGTNMQRWMDGLTAIEGGTVSLPAYGTGLRDSMEDMLVNIPGCLVTAVYSLISLRVDPRRFVTTHLALTYTQIHVLSVSLAKSDLRRSFEIRSAASRDADENVAATVDEPTASPPPAVPDELIEPDADKFLF